MCRLKDTLDMIYIKSNSGIGGAIILNGAVVEGAHRLAGAFGHMPIVPEGEPCGCGQRGCLVTVAGPDAVLHAAGLGPLLASRGLAVALDEFADSRPGPRAAALAAWDGAAGMDRPGPADPGHVVRPAGYRPGRLSGRGWRTPWRNILPASGLRLGLMPWLGAPSWWRAGSDGDAALLGAIWSARDRLLLDPAPNFHIVQPLNY